MKSGAKKFASVFALMLAGALAVAPFALNGCTNNAAPAQSKNETAATIAYTANPVKGNPLNGAVGSLPLWRSAEWRALNKATHENKTLPLTHVACVYDANNLYVAFAGTPGAGSSKVSVWLDCSAKQNGTELLEISTSVAKNQTADFGMNVMRHRSVTSPEVRDTPDFTLPMAHIEQDAKPFTVVYGGGTVDGKEAWTVVFAIPYRALNFPPNFVPTAGFNWRFNLLRTDTVNLPGGATEVVQANLSPVHAGAQQVMPYRMATMTLSKNSAVGAIPNVPAKPVRVALSR